MPPASIVLEIEKARAARAALDGRPPPRLLRPALVPLAVAVSVDERASSVLERLLRARAARGRFAVARRRHLRGARSR